MDNRIADRSRRQRHGLTSRSEEGTRLLTRDRQVLIAVVVVLVVTYFPLPFFADRLGSG